MPQAAIGLIDPTTTSGTDLAALLTAFGAAIEGGNAGSGRPSYIQPGGFWVDTSVSGVMSIKVFLGGTADSTICSINTSSGVVTFNGTSLGGGGPPAAPASRVIRGVWSLTGGGDLTADRNITLLNDADNPGGNAYYGTNGSGNKGWLPNLSPKFILQRGAWENPGTYTWTVPGNVNSAKVTVVGAGSTLGQNAGMICAIIPVTPGAVIAITVAGSGAGTSSFGPYLAATDAGVVGAATGISFDTAVPRYVIGGGVGLYYHGQAAIDDGSGGIAGSPGTGLVIVEWVQPA